jgi:lipoprotein-anchoring transpeptidase ErfK/SrfK
MRMNGVNAHAKNARVHCRPWPMAVGAAVILILLVAVFILIQARPSRVSREPLITPEIVKLDPSVLHKQIALAEARVQKLEQKTKRLFPTSDAILVDTAQNQISMVRGSQVIAQAKCSTGSGLELKDTAGNRTWTFETPRGYFRVISTVSNPVWYRPDWAFIEEGTPIPKDRASRAVADVLGDYALAFGDGYFIHGTLYTRMLGTSVTHGCIRVDDKTLEKIYQAAQPGTPIWIY